MLQVATLALALTPSLQQPAGDALVVYSGGVEELLADPRDAGLRRALAALDELLSEASAEGAFVHDVLTRPFCLRVGGEPEAPRVQLTVKCASESDAKALTVRARQLVDEADVDTERFGSLDVGSKGATLWIALGGRQTESFDYGASALAVRYDAARATELLEPWVDDEDGWTALRAIGLVGAGWSRFDLGYDGDRAVAVKRRPVGAHDGTLKSSDLHRIPHTATIAGVFPFAPGAVLDWIDGFDPDASAGLIDGLHDATEIHLRTDLFDHLGPVGGFFTSSATGGSPMSGVLFWEAREPELVSASLARLVGAVGDFARPNSFEHAGVTCTSLTFPGLPVPAEPCYAVAGGALYVAGNPYALRDALDQLGAETSVLDHPRVAAVVGEGERTAWRSFTFFDAPYYLERGYAAASQFALLAENMARSDEGLGEDIAPLLPKLSSLTRHAQPWVGWSRIEGSEVVHHTSFDRSLTSNLVALAGSPIVSGTSMLAAVAIPKLLSSRLAANESAAIATLRSTASAQAQFQSMAVVDANDDGVGEYGFFGEMSGARPLRRADGALLEPPVLSTRMLPQDDGAGRGVVSHSGYVFQMWLGRPAADGVVRGVTEPMSLRADPSPVAVAPYWCCYAWPLNPGQTGNRVFVVNQDGDVHFLNEPGRYFGLAGQGGRAPSFDAAYERSGDLSAPLAQGAGADGGRWMSLGSTSSH